MPFVNISVENIIFNLNQSIRFLTFKKNGMIASLMALKDLACTKSLRHESEESWIKYNMVA